MLKCLIYGCELVRSVFDIYSLFGDYEILSSHLYSCCINNFYLFIDVEVGMKNNTNHKTYQFWSCCEK